MELSTPVSSLRSVGPKRASALRRLGIETVYDLLHHYPTSWTFPDDPGQVLVDGAVDQTLWQGNRYTCRVVNTNDQTTVHLIWFNGQYAANLVRKGCHIIATGKRTEYGLTNPEFRVAPSRDKLDPTDLATATYPVTAGITSRDIGRLIKQVIDGIDIELPDWLLTIHNPSNAEEYQNARHWAKYCELFYMQLGLALRQHQRDTVPPNVRCLPSPINLRMHFPYEFTGDQEKAVRQIEGMMTGPRAMNVLLQGDVGSGKTWVAAYAAMLMACNGGQTAILCPTQVLAEQHYKTVRGLFEAAGLQCYLLLGDATKAKESYCASAVLIGTTSLLEGVAFHRLGLVVIDEQHKFGVEQRAALRRHGNPHTLTMTATPIPRTITMTAFGDLDTLTLRDMPPGREPVYTRWVRGDLDTPIATIFGPVTPEELIGEELGKGHQVYVVCPRIEALDDEMRAVEEVVDEYKRTFPRAGVAAIHGQLHPADRKRIMDDFVAQDFQILVSTTVIEVGVDNPNATVMVVEGAERFGLAQLHQLRGRVGRSDKQSYCFLLSDTESSEGRARLRTMERTNDGFEIAEADLKLRGPGDLLSTEQHGLPNLRIADLIEDYELLLGAREDARECIEEGVSPGDMDELKRRFGDKLVLGDS